MRRALIVVLVLTLGLLVAAPGVFAAAGTPRGEVNDYAYSLATTAQPGEDAISIPLWSWQTTTPADLAPHLGSPFWHVDFDTPDTSASDYTPSAVAAVIGPWLPTIAAHSNIDWVLTIGNEPNIDNTMNSSQLRAALINLWNNYLAGLAAQYPMLHIYAALPTINYEYAGYPIQAQDVMQWLSASQAAAEGVPAGGIRDMYYGMADHVYADWNYAGISQQENALYTYLLNDQYTHHMAINETGINACSETMLSKAQQYQAWINGITSSKVDLVTAFVGDNSDPGWVCYDLNTVQEGQIIGNHW